jgi:glycosyltransferase involved in cell wall biosynthesis
VLVRGGEAEFTETLGALLSDAAYRRDLAEGARRHAMSFSWDDTIRAVAGVLDASLEGVGPLAA